MSQTRKGLGQTGCADGTRFAYASLLIADSGGAAPLRRIPSRFAFAVVAPPRIGPVAPAIGMRRADVSDYSTALADLVRARLDPRGNSSATAFQAGGREFDALFTTTRYTSQ